MWPAVLPHALRASCQIYAVSLTIELYSLTASPGLRRDSQTEREEKEEREESEETEERK